MKTLATIIPLALATGLFGQAVYRNFGSVVFPGGTAGTSQALRAVSVAWFFPAEHRCDPCTASPRRRPT
jgi:hypothetical protein